jgi:hypothetical protein
MYFLYLSYYYHSKNYDMYICTYIRFESSPLFSQRKGNVKQASSENSRLKNKHNLNFDHITTQVCTQGRVIRVPVHMRGMKTKVYIYIGPRPIGYIYLVHIQGFFINLHMICRPSYHRYYTSLHCRPDRSISQGPVGLIRVEIWSSSPFFWSMIQ